MWSPQNEISKTLKETLKDIIECFLCGGATGYCKVCKKPSKTWESALGTIVYQGIVKYNLL